MGNLSKKTSINQDNLIRETTNKIFDALNENLNLTNREEEDARRHVSDLIRDMVKSTTNTLHKVGTVTDGDAVDVCVLCRYENTCPEDVHVRCLKELKNNEYYLKDE